MRKKLSLLFLLSVLGLGLSFAAKQPKHTFPYFEYVNAGKHYVLQIPDDYFINLNAICELDNQDGENGIAWFMIFKGFKLSSKNEGKLIMRLGDEELINLTPQSISSSGIAYALTNEQMAQIIEKGIIKWRMSSGFSAPYEKSYEKDEISKTITPVYQAIRDAICQKNVWTSNLSESDWNKAKREVFKLPKNFKYRDGVTNNVHYVTNHAYVEMDGFFLLEFIGAVGPIMMSLEADVNESQDSEEYGKRKWYIEFVLSDKNPFYVVNSSRVNVSMRLGDGSLVVLSRYGMDSKVNTTKYGDYYWGAVNCEITEEQLEKIVNEGILSFHVYGEIENDPYRMYIEYDKDKLGSVIRAIYPEIKQRISVNKLKSFDSDF